MKKKLLVLLVAGIVLLTAASCTGDKNNETDSQTDSATESDSYIVVGSGDESSDTDTDTEAETEKETIDPTEESPVFEEKSMKVVIVTWNANIRSRTDTKADSIVGGAKEGDILNVTGESKNWYRIEGDLYVAKTVAADAAALEGFTAVDEQVVISGGSVNVRSYPSADTDSIRGSLTEGTVVTRVAVGESWSRIKYEITNEDGVKVEKEYYVYNKYISTELATETDSEGK